MKQLTSVAVGLAAITLLTAGLSQASLAATPMKMSSADGKKMDACMAMSSDMMMKDKSCKMMMKKMKMSDMDMKEMASCKAMSKDAMMADSKCASMMKMHPDMMMMSGMAKN